METCNPGLSTDRRPDALTITDSECFNDLTDEFCAQDRFVDEFFSLLYLAARMHYG